MKILVLAGGADQIALIDELHSRGHEVILVDFFENPPAARVADKHIIASTLDVLSVKEIALKEKVHLITTACTDQALLTVAKVSEELSLPCYISYQTALNVTNKQHMKSMMIRLGIPTAKYSIIGINDLQEVESFRYPLVVKPVDCNSSKGVRKVSNKEELKHSIKNAILLSRTNTAIVEEFKYGKEISADFYVEGCNVKLLSITSSNKIKTTNSFTIVSSYYPAVSVEEEHKILEIARKIVNAFDLCNTPLLIQMIIDNSGDIDVLEFSARIGGGSKYNLIKVISGVDIMKVYVDLILGDTPNIAFLKKQEKYVQMNYVYCSPGIFKEAVNFDVLMEEKVIDAWFQYKVEGTEILRAENSGDRPLGFLITADTKEELRKKIFTADAKLQVLNESGIDIMLHGLY